MHIQLMEVVPDNRMVIRKALEPSQKEIAANQSNSDSTPVSNNLDGSFVEEIVDAPD